MRHRNQPTHVRPCAAAIALALALPLAWPGSNTCAATTDHAAFQPATSIDVANCNDSGPGSLRAAVASAASGDMIDLSELTCSTISLTTGQIEIPQDNLYLKYSGEGGTPPTITSNFSSRIFHHTGTGTLRLVGLTLAYGKYDDSNAQQAVSANGGCIYSTGSVYLLGTNVNDCVAKDTLGYRARGGGIYAYGALTLIGSVVSGNAANSKGSRSSGGGVYSHRAMEMEYSSVSGNSTNADNQRGSGGGIAVDNVGSAPSSIANSTIDNNSSDGAAGIYFNGELPQGAALTILSSTISSNTAVHGTAAAGHLSGQISIQNSTIASNTSYIGPAVMIYPAPGVLPVDFESSIFFGNISEFGTYEYDVGSNSAPVTITGAANIVGAHNNGLVLPSDTLSADPLLQPLADNGGVTRTHALGNGSPAIDSGNNAAGLTVDQRGPGYPRVFGARADIGAFERQTPEDTIFVNGFE